MCYIKEILLNNYFLIKMHTTSRARTKTEFIIQHIRVRKYEFNQSHHQLTDTLPYKTYRNLHSHVIELTI